MSFGIRPPMKYPVTKPDPAIDRLVFIFIPVALAVTILAAIGAFILSFFP